MGNKGGKEKGRKLSGRKEDAGRGSTAGVAEFGSSLVLTDGTSSSGAPPQTKEERLNVVNSYKALNERALSDHRSRLQHVTVGGIVKSVSCSALPESTCVPSAASL